LDGEAIEGEGFAITALRSLALEIHERLLRIHGQPEKRRHLDPLSQLVSAILSQNTSDTNRDKAFKRLRERFPKWEEVLEAELEEIVEAIRPAGLANLKAPRIQEALRTISIKRGELTLDFLASLPLDEAKAWLMELKGVGPKTAAIVLLFSLDKPAFPVDTHINRVTKRLGLIGEKVPKEKAHELLEQILPEEIYYSFHLNVIAHGREVCKARNPRCEICVLQDICSMGHSK
jgi:endonuclease-3